MDISNKEILHTALSQQDLVDQLNYLGLNSRMCVEVHCAFKQIGFVIGGAQTLNNALKEVLKQGTIVMPCQSSDNSEPLTWENPPIDIQLADKVRENFPAYNPLTADIHYMGALANNFRNSPDIVFSSHPTCGFMAWGKDSQKLMDNQPLNFPLAENSPLDKMYHLANSYILLIGVPYSNATGMHFGECLSKVRNIVINGASMMYQGQKKWIKYLDYDIDSEEFVTIGHLMEENKLVKAGKLGNAICLLLPFKTTIDFTREYFIQTYGG